VRQLREFNLALLGKWCWGMLVDRGGLWYRVLVARHGEEAGRLKVGGRSVSIWWREIVKIREGIGVDGGVGDGSDTLFWHDRWLGDAPLCRRFDHLFGLALNKHITVAEMFTHGWEVRGDAWRWRRQLWAWEEEFLGNNFVVQTDVSDRWKWLPDTMGGYTVRGAYQLLTHQVAPMIDVTGEHVWHKQVPLKVSILAWRLLHDRLPTKLNLFRRGIIQHTDVSCVAGCGFDESATHLFLHCASFGSIWQHIRNWLGISGVDLLTLHGHFFQFTNSIGMSRKRRSFMQLLWLLCVWIVWNERNNRIFKNIQTTMTDLLEKVKYQSLWWLKAHKVNFVYGNHNWWSDPLLCLSID